MLLIVASVTEQSLGGIKFRDLEIIQSNVQTHFTTRDCNTYSISDSRKLRTK